MIKKKGGCFKSILKVGLLLLALLVGGGLVVTLVFPLPLAQWAMERLRPYGLQGEIIKVGGFPAKLTVRRLVFLRQRQGMTFRLQAKKGKVRLPLWAILLGARRISRIEVQGPTIEVERQKRPSGQRRKSLARRRKWLQGVTGRLLRVGELVVTKGRLRFRDFSQPGLTSQVTVGELSGNLVGFQGNIQLKQIKVLSERQGQKITVSIPQGEALFDLERFLAQDPPAVKEVVLHRPQLRWLRTQAAVPRPAQPGKLARLPRLRRIQIKEGTVTLLDHSRPGRFRQWKLRRLQADLHHLNLRYLLARPFRGTARVHLGSYSSPVRFQANPLAQKGKSADKEGNRAEEKEERGGGERRRAHQFRLEGIPLQAANTALPPDSPLFFASGKLSCRLTLTPQEKERVRITAQARFEGLLLRPRPGKTGFRGLVWRLALGMLNRLLQQYLNNQNKQTVFFMTQEELADHPPKMFRLLLKRAFQSSLDTFFQKHPRLRRFRPALLRRLKKRRKGKNGLGRIKGRLPLGRRIKKVLRKVQKRRQERRKIRQKRRQERRQKRQERRKKRRGRLLKGFKKWRKERQKRRQERRKARQERRKKLGKRLRNWWKKRRSQDREKPKP